MQLCRKIHVLLREKKKKLRTSLEHTMKTVEKQRQVQCGSEVQKYKKKGEVYVESYYFISGAQLFALEGQVGYGEGNVDCRAQRSKNC